MNLKWYIYAPAHLQLLSNYVLVTVFDWSYQENFALLVRYQGWKFYLQHCALCRNFLCRVYVSAVTKIVIRWELGKTLLNKVNITVSCIFLKTMHYATLCSCTWEPILPNAWQNYTQWYVFIIYFADPHFTSIYICTLKIKP